MWESRQGQLPPAKFFAEALATLSAAYPDAVFEPGLLKRLEYHLIREWQRGQSGPNAAKATCSCDGRTITMSPVVVSPSGELREPLPKGSVRPPKGAKRDGVIPTLESLRESKSLTDARRRHAEAIAAVEAKTALLADLNAAMATGATKDKSRRLDKAAHDLETAMSGLAQAESDLLKAKEAAKWINRQIPVPTLPKQEAQVHQPCTACSASAAQSAAEPAAEPAAQSGAVAEGKKKGRRSQQKTDSTQMFLGLEAVPSAEAPSRHNRLLKIKAAFVPVSTIDEARQKLLDFIVEHGLTIGNFGGVAGEISSGRDGVVAQIGFTGGVTILRPDLIPGAVIAENRQLESSTSEPYRMEELESREPQTPSDDPDDDLVAKLLDDFAAARTLDGRS